MQDFLQLLDILPQHTKECKQAQLLQESKEQELQDINNTAAAVQDLEHSHLETLVIQVEQVEPQEAAITVIHQAISSQNDL